jgi:hypothetical protein
MASVPPHVTPLRLVQPASIDLTLAVPALTAEPIAWLGTPVAAPRSGIRRYLTDLSLPIREQAPSITFRKAAFVDIGEVRRTPTSCEIEIGWQSSSLAPLFPVFAGHLTLTSGQLLLEGYYAPPGGEIGAALDRAFLGIAARGTARWFLERAAEIAGATAPNGHPADFRSPNSAARPVESLPERPA